MDAVERFDPKPLIPALTSRATGRRWCAWTCVRTSAGRDGEVSDHRVEGDAIHRAPK